MQSLPKSLLQIVVAFLSASTVFYKQTDMIKHCQRFNLGRSLCCSNGIKRGDCRSTKQTKQAILEFAKYQEDRQEDKTTEP